MAARLGNVIYWSCCVVAVIALVVGLIVLINPGRDAAIWIPRYFGTAIGAFIVGRAARYILAGR